VAAAAAPKLLGSPGTPMAKAAAKAARAARATCGLAQSEPAALRSGFIRPKQKVGQHRWRRSQQQAGRTVDLDAQAKALRLRLYVLCSECAHLIDLTQGIGPSETSKAKIFSGTKPKSTRSGWKYSG
jgi:hypothetical protein